LRGGVPWDQHFARDEEYLKVAVSRLLPQYYGSDADAATGQILRNMARIFVDRHHDNWLRDVLRTPHSRTATEAFVALGRALDAWDIDDWKKSSAEAETALRSFKAVGIEAGAPRAQLVLMYVGRLGNSAECASAGRSLQSGLRRKGYSWILTETLSEAALCEKFGGDFDQAWATHQEAMQAAGQFNYPVLLLRVLTASAAWQREMGNRSTASQNIMRGLSLYWSGRYPSIRAHDLYTQLSLMDPQVDLPYSAAAWAREAAETISHLNRPAVQAATLHQRALTEMLVGLDGPADQHLKESYAWLAKLPVAAQPSWRAIHAVELAEAEASAGEVNKPLAQLENLGDQVLDALDALWFNTLMGKLRLKRGEYAEARRVLSIALEMGNNGGSKLPEADRLSWTHALGDTYRALVECEIRSGANARQSWELWARYRTALFGRGAAPQRFPEVQPGEAVLSFAELPSGVGIWLGTPQEFKFRWLPDKPNAVREAAGGLVRGCANPRSPVGVVRADGRQLSQMLLGDWEKELAGVRTLVIEGDGPASAVPWPALVRTNGHYWSEDFAVRSRVAVLPPKAPGMKLSSVRNVLAVGEPLISGENLPPLSDARREAEQVCKRFGAPGPLEGRAATLSDVRERLAGAEIFHFAGHGYGGDGGGLVLRGVSGGMALLSASEIQSLHLSRCRLAVLSGCATGSGERNGPGDPQSLVRAFLRVGAENVVASLWNLASAPTQQFMGELYAGLFADMKVEDSLRRAAAAVRTTDGYRHPYYWAGIQVYNVQ